MEYLINRHTGKHTDLRYSVYAIGRIWLLLRRPKSIGLINSVRYFPSCVSGICPNCEMSATVKIKITVLCLTVKKIQDNPQAYS